MQQTRQLILETLHEKGEATVDELVQSLQTRLNHDITSVTVRHHLDVLRSEELITPPSIRRRRTPGRPQYSYMLTDKAVSRFPNNYQALSAALLNQLKASLPPSQVNVILADAADEMAASAVLLDGSIEARLDGVVQYLDQHGYEADWEPCTDGFILRTRNCPYHQIVGEHEELCGLDFRLISGLLGIIPRRLGRIVEGDDSCAYLIPTP